MEFKFKKEYPDFLKRKEESVKLRAQCPDKIPIICEKDPKSRIDDIDKTKYLVPGDLPINKFIAMIRKRVRVSEEEAFYLLIGGKQINGDGIMKEIYEKFKDRDDGFLYCVYASELTWG